MISLGYLGLLESLSKLETRYIKIIVRKKDHQKKNFYMNGLKSTETEWLR